MPTNRRSRSTGQVRKAAKGTARARSQAMPSKLNPLRVGASQPVKRVTGSGGYVSDLAGKAGSWLGNKAGGWLERLFGLGAYTVRKNSLIPAAGSAPNDPPLLTNTRGGTVVRHREFVQDILAASTFTVQAFPINPGLPKSYPWASGISAGFTQVRHHGIIYEYKSTATTAVSTSTSMSAGVVIQATNYNVNEPLFTDKRTMENYMYVTACSPYENALHPVECAPATAPISEYYIRSGDVPTADLRFNDIGNYQIAVDGCQSGVTGKIGELWVTYEMEFLKPRLPTTFSSQAPTHYQFNTALYPSLDAPTVAQLFGTNANPGSKVLLRGVGSQAVVFPDGTSNKINFTSNGRYMVALTIQGDSATIGYGAPTFIQDTGVTGAAIFSFGPTLSILWRPNDGASTTYVILAAFDVDLSLNNGPAGIEFTPSVIPANVASLDLFVTPLPTGFTIATKTIEAKLMERVLKLENLLKYQDFELDSKEGYTTVVHTRQGTHRNNVITNF